MRDKAKETELDANALPILRQLLLKRGHDNSLEAVATKYKTKKSILQRRVRFWLDQPERFDIVDLKKELPTAKITKTSQSLANDLMVCYPDLFRAIVIYTDGVPAAYTDRYNNPPESPEAQEAYRDNDILHQFLLSKFAARYFLELVRFDATIGLAAGRAIAGMVGELSILKTAGHQEDTTIGWNRPIDPSTFSKLKNVKIISLCGGQRGGMWALPIGRGTDADDNAFLLEETLETNNVKYAEDWLGKHNKEIDSQIQNTTLSIFCAGLGVLNTRHHMLAHSNITQLGEISSSLQQIKDLQSQNKSLHSRIADIGNRLFQVGLDPIPPALTTAIETINAAAPLAPPHLLLGANETILTAASDQKVWALIEVLNNNCPDLPINLAKTTLITSEDTAKKILAGNDPRTSD